MNEWMNRKLVPLCTTSIRLKLHVFPCRNSMAAVIELKCSALTPKLAVNVTT